MIRNLGQVAAIYIGSSAPRNTNLIWLDNTVVPFVFRAYDGSAWSEIATHKWVRAYVDGWLVTLPPRQLADDGDYMLINSNNVNYKITVKDFVKSAVGNPLDFKGVIRVSADFPNPSTLESGDMYVIITSPAGGTVTDPYSGKTFEDSEKIVWDEVTQSWESLGKIDITVDLTTSYSETEVTIHSSAGKETTIQGATDQLAGVMLPGQYSWLQALSNGSIVPGDPSPLTPLTPAHKHNYNDIINRLVSQQGTGESTIDPMSQKATTDALNLKFDKASVLQVSGAATDKVMSQKAVTDALKTLSDDFNNKLTNYLPLAGGTMKGSIRFPAESGIIGNADGTGDTYILRSFNNRLDIGSAALSTRIISNASDLLHHRSDTSYKIWDAYNLSKPTVYNGGAIGTPTTIYDRNLSVNGTGWTFLSATNAPTTSIFAPTTVGTKGYYLVSSGTGAPVWQQLEDLGDGKYLPLAGGTMTGSIIFPNRKGIFGRLTDGTGNIKIAVVNANNNVEIGNSNTPLMLVSNSTDLTHYRDNNTYEIWDKYNLTNPVTYTTDTYNYATLRNKDGQYFTYIKAGTNGLLPHSQATLANGGAGLLGTSDQSFNAAYINNLHTNKVTFGETGPYITRSTSATQFLDANGGAQKVATGGLYVGVSYASDALNLVPANGIYSRGIIYIENGIGFRNSIWTNDLTPNKNYSGYLQVLDAYDANNAGGPTNYGTVLQVNSRNAHWANQLWFPGGAEASKNGLYYRHMAYNETTYGEWHRLLTNKDVNILSASYNNNPNSLPTNQIFYAETQGVAGTPTSSGLLFSVQGDDEGIQLWAGANRTELYYRTKWTSFGNWIKLATTSDLGNYLPLTGGTLSGTLTINTVGSTTLVINNNDTNGSETFMRVLRKGTASAAIGFMDSLGAYIYNYNSNKYLFIDNDGYARVGTTNGSTKLALITDIPTVSGYLPLSGGTMTGALTMNSRKNNAVIDVVGGTGNNWHGGAGALSVQVPGDGGQTPLILARRSGAAINTTVATERLLSMELLDTGHSFIIGMSGSEALQLDWTSGKAGTGKLFGKTIATTDQIPSIPSISISNSGSGNAVTAISASGHTLTVTKGATYLTSSSLDGYATQSWANGQFASLSLYNTTGSYTTIRTRGNEFCLGNTIATSASNEVIVNYRIPSGCTYAPSTWVWRAGSSTSYANGYWGSLYMNDNLVATQSWASGQFPTKTGTGASGTWGISITGNATTATTASKLGSTTIGGSAKPIYLSSGTPTACSATVGSATVPVYMNAGTITQCSTTLGVSITGNAATATNSTQLGGTAASSYVKANDNISRLTNDSGYTTQEWVNSQNFVKSTSTKKVTDIQPVDALPATQASGVLYLVFG